jgi:hypothetical protein
MTALPPHLYPLYIFSLPSFFFHSLLTRQLFDAGQDVFSRIVSAAVQLLGRAIVILDGLKQTFVKPGSLPLRWI